MNDDDAAGPAERITVAAVGDLHVKETTSPGAYRDMFGEISKAADALVLAGDLTDLGKAREAEILAADLKACSIPVIAVLGNHDHECGDVEALRRILREAGVTLLEGQTCEVKGVGFVGVKGYGGGFGRRMLGSFGESATKSFVNEAMNEAMLLENGLRQVRSKRAMVVLHYAPIAETVEGEPEEIYPFLGCSRLAETIDRFKVTSVVHGHAHRGRYEGKTPAGIPVFNVAMHIEKPTGKPYALLQI